MASGLIAAERWAVRGLCDQMSRVFLSHSSRDNRHAIALKRWLEQAEPGLAGEIYLDLALPSNLVQREWVLCGSSFELERGN